MASNVIEIHPHPSPPPDYREKGKLTGALRRCAEAAAIRQRVVEGLILGGCFGVCAYALNLGAVAPGSDYYLPMFAVLGAGVALTRVRRLLWGMNAVILILLSVVLYTPLTLHLMRGAGAERFRAERAGSGGSW